jgi:membrane protease YdiL (CAAX protease family)
MVALLLSYIWGWQGAFPGHFGVVFAVYVLLGASSHMRRGETAKDIGATLAGFGRALSLAARIVGPVVLTLLIVGALRGTLTLPPFRSWPAAFAWTAFWGTAQQYGLLCFFYRRFRELLPGSTQAKLAAAAAFAAFHLPNPFLVPVTFAAGLVASWIYDRAPNLWALGLAHGITGLVLTRALPPSVTGGMRVGPGYLHHIAG